MMIRWLFQHAWFIAHLMFTPVPKVDVTYAAYVASSGIALPTTTDQSGIGSMYGSPGDKWKGGRMACPPHDPVPQNEHTCAHRFYPCGTLLVIEYPKTGKRTWCKVTDRGPYGANVFASDGTMVYDNSAPAWYVMIHPHDLPPDGLCPGGGCTGRWRGIIDMTPAVAKSIGHPGMGYVHVWTLRRVVDYEKYLLKKAARPTS